MSQLLEHKYMEGQQGSGASEGNELFPVFLKLNQLRVLLVGAGYVGHEKLHALLANSPRASVKIVALQVSKDVEDLSRSFPQVTIIQKGYEASDLEGVDLVIAATEDRELNQFVRQTAREQRLLVNVADKPELCDFYLGSIVKKGNLKIAISTNGKSPTLAKRLREVLQSSLPEEIEASLEQLNQLRDQLKGDFADKVKQLNAVTASLVEQGNKKE